MKAKVFVVQQYDEWFYTWEGDTQTLPMLANLKNTRTNSTTNQGNITIRELGEIETETFTETIKQRIGEFFRPHETELTRLFRISHQTRIILGRDGKIYTFRQPEDILKNKITPVRLGYFFKEIPKEVLAAWEQHLTICLAKPIITTDPKIWKAAYRDILSCMKDRKEIQFYIENPQSFEIAVLYNEEKDKVIARAVIYKATNGERYYYKIYGNTSRGYLEKFIKEQGIKAVPFNTTIELPTCIARSKVGIPYLDAFQYGKLFDEEYTNGEHKYKLKLFNRETRDVDVILQYVHYTQSLLEDPCVCADCEMLFPREVMQGDYCENCRSLREEIEAQCDVCGVLVPADEIVYANGFPYCPECYESCYTAVCDFCGEVVDINETPVHLFAYVSIELDGNTNIEAAIEDTRTTTEDICLDCFRECMFGGENKIIYKFSNHATSQEDTEDQWYFDDLRVIIIYRTERPTILIPVHRTELGSVLRSETFIDFLKKLNEEIKLSQ